MFQNRVQAGRLLASKLLSLQASKPLIVLAIPRGGVPVGAEIAKALNCPLDIVVTKKIGAPGNPELAVGAMGSDESIVWDKSLLARLSLSPSDLAPQIKNAKLKIKSYNAKFKVREKNLKDKVVILTDDGIATGATVEAAIKVVKSQGPIKIVVAMPVAPPDSVKKLEPLVDEFICLKTPSFFAAVGQFYQQFGQVTDEEVMEILAESLASTESKLSFD